MNVPLSDLIIAGATVVLVGVTVWYACLTYRLLKATYKPQIRINLRPRESAEYPPNFPLPPIEIRVKNVGPGIAREIRFSQHDFRTDERESTLLNDDSFIVNGIDALGPGEEVVCDATPYYPISGEIRHTWRPVSIDVTCKDFTGKEYPESFLLDFNTAS